MTARPHRWRGPALQRGAAWALALAGLLLAGGCATLQDWAIGAPDGNVATEAPKAPIRPSAELTVLAPEPLNKLLEKHLDLARLQEVDLAQAPTAGEWSRLIRSAPAQARLLLQTEGYFEPEVTVIREDAPPPGPAAARRLTIRVEPGVRVVVASVRVQAEGEIARRQAAGDATAAALEQSLPDAGELKPGEPFRNDDWRQTKQKVVSALRNGGYLAASLADSRAEIDTEARSAALNLTVDSGPLFLAGALDITGIQKQDEATPRNLAGLPPGTPLTEQTLLEYQERLQKVRLYQAVNVAADADPAQAAAATVHVRLAELPLQQTTIGIGYSDSTHARATLEHTHRRPFDWPVTIYNKFEIGTTSQTWTGDLQTHPGPGFYRNVLGVLADNVQGDTDVVQSQSLRLGRTQDTKRLERYYFLELLRSHQSSDLAPSSTATSLSANYNLVLRRVDNVLLPTRGYTLALQGGAGYAVSHEAENGPFARLYGRLTAYQPLGGEWYAQGRIETGYVVKGSAVDVPDKLGFRAGGDESVRGYDYRSLSPVDSAGVQYSGMALATTSLELAHPILADLPSVWGAVFVDAGRAVVDFKDFKPAVGYGVGARWRSPVGPLRVDLAWAEELRTWRVHISLGIQL